MSKRMDAPDKVVLLLAIVPYLLEHGETSVSTLADTFDLQPTVLRQLIEFLGTAGVPGETSTYQHEDLFDLDWEALEDRDSVRLIRAVAVDDTPRFSATERAALIAGLHSITPLLPDDQRHGVSSALEKLGSHDLSLSVAEIHADERIVQLSEAMTSSVRVQFSYTDLNGRSSERSVEPLSLTQSSDRWYLKAFCLDRLAERTFLVDAMRAITVDRDHPARRKSPHSFPSAIGPGELPLSTTISVRESALHRVAPFAPRLLNDASEQGAGWVRAEVQLAFARTAIRLVQAAPSDVIIVSPRSARAAVADWAQRALAQYSA